MFFAIVLILQDATTARVLKGVLYTKLRTIYLTLNVLEASKLSRNLSSLETRRTLQRHKRNIIDPHCRVCVSSRGGIELRCTSRGHCQSS